MRIAYGVHGYSRGHATRALAVLPELARQYQVKVFAGGDAYETLKGSFDVQRIPSMSYRYSGGRRSTLHTLHHNLPLFLDLLVGGASLRAVISRLQQFAPHVVISDAESWTHRAARRLGIPRIGFDHFGVMVHCKLELSPTDWLESLVDRGVYGLLTGKPERVLISSFYRLETRHEHIELIPPLLREGVHRLEPEQGEHVLVYLNQGSVQLTPRLLRALGRLRRPLRFYGTPRRGTVGRIDYRPASEQEFLEDLASCYAVVSTAGNQLVGEALRFGKPLLVLPEATVEQRLNGRAVARLGVGEMASLDQLTTGRIEAFLERCGKYRERAKSLSLDGRPLAVARLKQWVEELSRPLPPTIAPAMARRAEGSS